VSGADRYSMAAMLAAQVLPMFRHRNLYGLSFVIFCAIVFTILHPPKKYQMIWKYVRRITHKGTVKVVSDPYATRRMLLFHCFLSVIRAMSDRMKKPKIIEGSEIPVNSCGADTVKCPDNNSC
jgi:hypothetical protein